MPNNLQQQAITRNILLNELKNEIKNLIEIASDENGNTNLNEHSITNLCAIIDACLLYGLSADFSFKTTFDLLKKLIKCDCDSLKIVVKQCNQHSPSQNYTRENQLWIQISILNRFLIDIIECIIINAGPKYYANYSLVSNPFDSQVFYSLLAGLDVIKFNPSPASCSKLLVLSSSPANILAMSPKYTNRHPKLESFISPIFNNRDNQNNLNSSSINVITASTKKKEAIKRLCDGIETKILSNFFYEWLNYHRKNKLIKRSLIHIMADDEKLKEEDGPLSGTDATIKEYLKKGKMLDEKLWQNLIASNIKTEEINKNQIKQNLVFKLVYVNGIENRELRRKVWPYLLNHYRFDMTVTELELKHKQSVDNYERLLREWEPFEQYKRIVDEINLNNTLCSLKKENQHLIANQIGLTTTPIKPPHSHAKDDDSGICSDLTNSDSYSSNRSDVSTNTFLTNLSNSVSIDIGNGSKVAMQTPVANDLSVKKNNNKLSSLFSSLKTSNSSSKSRADLLTLRKENEVNSLNMTSTTNGHHHSLMDTFSNAKNLFTKIIHISSKDQQQYRELTSHDEVNYEELQPSPPVSPVSSHEHEECNNSEVDSCFFSPSFYDLTASPPPRVLENKQLFDNFSMNMHRIDKDVVRCDRNYSYFSNHENLDKLKNVIYTYVWENIDIGYIQGMCDLIAPLLVVMDNEPLVYECFKKVMTRMCPNFISSSTMEKNFSSLNSLLAILDKELHTYMNNRYNMNQNGMDDESELGTENTSSRENSLSIHPYNTQYNSQFYFTYRWFLLDFKRELAYADIFSVWETIWSARNFCTENFSLFVALALVHQNRSAIMDNHMDFTDIIQYFNELSEKHEISKTLNLARDFVEQLNQIISKFKNDIAT